MSTSPSAIDLRSIEVPAQIWLRSGRSLRGTAIRVYAAFVPIIAALFFPAREPIFAVLIAIGIAVFFVWPVVVQLRLRGFEARVSAADRSNARVAIKDLHARPLVRWFAPHAWTTLQEARLHLVLGEGRAAAHSLAETARLSRVPGSSPALASLRAGALLMANERKEARELLREIERTGTLRPIDRLHLAIALLLESGRADEALEHLDAVRAVLGDHARVSGARAFALAQLERAEEGVAALELAETELGEAEDEIARELIKRSRKALRTFVQAQHRREARGGKRSKPADSSEVHAPVPTTADPAGVRSPRAQSRADKKAKKAARERERELRRREKTEKKGTRNDPAPAASVAPKPIAVAPKPIAVAPKPIAVAPKPIAVAPKPALVAPLVPPAPGSVLRFTPPPIGTPLPPPPGVKPSSIPPSIPPLFPPLAPKIAAPPVIAPPPVIPAPPTISGPALDDAWGELPDAPLPPGPISGGGRPSS